MPLQEPVATSQQQQQQQPQVSDQIITSSPPVQQLLAPNTATSLQHVKRIIIGIGWDVGAGAFAGSGSAEVDLDASLTCFDAMGQYVDCIYFGNLVNANKSIQHTGDNKTGVGEGNDEEIIMQLDQIPPPTCICVLTINSYSGDTFANVNRAFVNVSNADRPGRELEMGTFSLSSAGPYTAMIMGKFYRSPADGTWIFHTIGLGAQGRSFGEILPSMQNQLKDLIPNIVIQPNPNIIIMTKGEAVAIVSKDQNVPLNQITLGLGWDQMGDNPIDLDASCCLFSDTNQHVDSVYFNHLQSNDGAIRHAGDNRSGAGDGDDEKVYVDLSRLSRNITSLFFIVNSYSGHQFSRIKNAYIRILESHNPRGMELMRFSLSTAQGPALSATAMIMCKLYRHPRTGQWMCKSLGYPTQGRTWNENIHEMQKELTGRLPQIDGFRFDPRAAQQQLQQLQQQQQQPQRQPQQQQQRPVQGIPPKNTNACCIIS